MPLTADRAKPAVPFAGIYRLIDFALSNVVNSGYLQGRRADAVQVAQPRPSRHADLADVDDARQLRHAGAGAAAGRQALVPRQRRRDLPVPEPDARRAARHRGRGGRRPRLPDGLLADGRPARRVAARRARSRRSGSRSRWPTSSASSTCTPTTPTRSASSSRSPRTPRGCPTAPHEVLASMGNYVFDADALVEAVTRDADAARLQARHGRRHRAGVRARKGAGRRLRLQGQHGAGLDRPRPRLLARRRDDRRPTTPPTWTSSRRCRSSTSTTSTGRSTRPTARSRR